MNSTKMNELIEQYANVYLFATKKIEHILAEKVIPMSVEQYGILRVLDMKGAATAKEVAEYTGVHKSAVTAKTTRLESKGLVKRTQSDQDRRHIKIELTEEGKKIYDQSKEAMAEFIAVYFKQLEADEVENFLNVYKKINKMLEQENQTL
ncbi:MarR family winged helix-turn-helix transcriptional regulator [Salipaludibacillus keqinensis]|uniref:MarR family winged helix-turn-helix transcriptional regulator n=1 Tax=Salipaludibacillus keqinensis TaxID=2045207 RepID=UPI0013048595|nr:MarR family transcriptional regulator [Salipaludibacillus keqinensis]